MKSTQERLAESYCKPKTEEEWAAIAEHFTIDALRKDYGRFGEIYFFQRFNGMLSYSKHPIKERTEIPVSHFIDLLQDRLAPWRLAEDGFTTLGGSVYSKRFTIDSEGDKITRTITVITDTGRVYLNDGPTNVSTYTQLLTLIELIG
jgi:hypothetical protein